MLKRIEEYYFSTRDLMMMAAMAAVGGVAGTYINFIGDFFQSILGFAGTTQWAAGLHVIWIMLATAIVRKPGTATATGILKGFVEFLSGNTHGLLVLIVNILAGLIVDLVLLPNKNKQPGWIFYLAAGLASASNIIVFQFFASIPEDILTFLAILISSVVAFISGIIFAGLMSKSLLTSLYKVGILSEPDKNPGNRSFIWPLAILLLALALTIGTGFFYLKQQSSTQGVQIDGTVANPYTFPNDFIVTKQTEIKLLTNGVSRSYTGTPLHDLVNYSEPVNESWVLQVSATDGYSFFISRDEILSNPDLTLTDQEVGGQTIYNLAGARSSKAWVRGVSQMKVIGTGQIQVSGRVENPFLFLPEEWIEEMDSTFINLEGETTKLQGIAVRSLWNHASPLSDANSIDFRASAESFNMPIEDFIDSDEIRIFTLLSDSGMEFVLGKMNGDVLLKGVQSIEIK
jgi:energy-coupling factor transport system substrate-specific component